MCPIRPLAQLDFRRWPLAQLDCRRRRCRSNSLAPAVARPPASGRALGGGMSSSPFSSLTKRRWSPSRLNGGARPAGSLAAARPPATGRAWGGRMSPRPILLPCQAPAAARPVALCRGDRRGEKYCVSERDGQCDRDQEESTMLIFGAFRYVHAHPVV
jgi:hypothetical protein